MSALHLQIATCVGATEHAQQGIIDLMNETTWMMIQNGSAGLLDHMVLCRGNQRFQDLVSDAQFVQYNMEAQIEYNISGSLNKIYAGFFLTATILNITKFNNMFFETAFVVVVNKNSERICSFHNSQSRDIVRTDNKLNNQENSTILGSSEEKKKLERKIILLL
ncbi:hypothetical protein ACJX0J_014016, partial [Zea mays]